MQCTRTTKTKTSARARTTTHIIISKQQTYVVKELAKRSNKKHQHNNPTNQRQTKENASIQMANLTLLVGYQWTQRWVGTSLYYPNQISVLVLVGCAVFPKKLLKITRHARRVACREIPILGIVTTVADIHTIVMFACIGGGSCHCARMLGLDTPMLRWGVVHCVDWTLIASRELCCAC